MSNPTLFLYTGNGTLAAQDRSGSLTLTGSGAVRYAPASGARTNLIYNPTFASGVTGVIASLGGSVSHEATGGVDGTGAARWTGSTINQGIRVNTGAANYVGRVNGNVSITFSFAAKAVSGATDWKIDFLTYDNAWNNLATSSATAFDITSDHARYSFEYTATGTGTHYIIPRIRRASTAAAIIEIDQLVLEVGSTDGSWFEPVWLDPLTGILGSANASPSVSQAVAWVEEGTMNLFTNPSMETNTTGWTAEANITATRVTTYAYYGSACVQLTKNTNGSASAGFLQNSTATTIGQSYTVSAWIRGTATACYLIAAGVGSGTPTAATDSWQRITYTFTATSTSTNIGIQTGTGNSGEILYVDGLQCENKAYATSYCDGSIGTGYAWSGTAHASSSTRTATALSVATTGRISNLLGSTAVRAAPDYIATGGFPSFLTAGVTGVGTDALIFYFPSTTNRATLERRHDNVTRSAVDLTPTMAAETWAMAYAYWNGTLQGVSLNNSDAAEATHTTEPTGNWGATGIGIGSNSAGGISINGYIGPVLIADRPLTARERALLNARTSWGWSTLKGGSIGRLTPF